MDCVGIDIDPRASLAAQVKLGPTARVFVQDALDPTTDWGRPSPDAIIANPPWGTQLPYSRDFYRLSGFGLASGQFDISSLFVEKALSLTRPGTVVGFILPDFLFQPEHRGLRKLLLGHTLVTVARLGEGIFPNVSRSATVIILRNGPAPKGHLVNCFQVPSSGSRMSRRASDPSSVLKHLHSHQVPQEQFRSNPDHVFDTTQDSSSYSIFRRFMAPPSLKWEETFFLGRGIEIGKNGLTAACKECGNYQPIRRLQESTICKSCGAMIPRDQTTSIVSKSPMRPGWSELIVGEDIDRYSATPSRQIKLGVPGIRYKTLDHFHKKKLLIRKTGVGIRTATDETNAAAVQAVFYVTPKQTWDSWLLDYLQGILNSRPMLAWYLRWSGENQWRSHPYVTPRVLKSLPVPEPSSDSTVGDLAQAIAAKAARARLGDNGAEHDVDQLTYRLFGLGAEASDWVSNVLHDTDDSLEYFQRMRQVRPPTTAAPQRRGSPL